MISFVCRVVGHVPDRNRIWDDGMDFRAGCRRCGAALIRDPSQGWRTFDPEVDLIGRGMLRTRHRQ